MQARRFFEGGDHLYDMARDIIWGGYKPKNGKFEPNEGRSEPGAVEELATFMGTECARHSERKRWDWKSSVLFIISIRPAPSCRAAKWFAVPDGMTKDSFERLIDNAFTRFGLDC
jgi:hypothetical protein